MKSFLEVLGVTLSPSINYSSNFSLTNDTQTPWYLLTVGELLYSREQSLFVGDQATTWTMVKSKERSAAQVLLWKLGCSTTRLEGPLVQPSQVGLTHTRWMQAATVNLSKVDWSEIVRSNLDLH